MIPSLTRSPAMADSSRDACESIPRSLHEQGIQAVRRFRRTTTWSWR